MASKELFQIPKFSPFIPSRESYNGMIFFRLRMIIIKLFMYKIILHFIHMYRFIFVFHKKVKISLTLYSPPHIIHTIFSIYSCSNIIIYIYIHGDNSYFRPLKRLCTTPPCNKQYNIYTYNMKVVADAVYCKYLLYINWGPRVANEYNIRVLRADKCTEKNKTSRYYID